MNYYVIYVFITAWFVVWISIISPLIIFLRLVCMGQCTEISCIDGACMSICHNKRLDGTRYLGCNLHLLHNENGELLNFMLKKANVR